MVIKESQSYPLGQCERNLLHTGGRKWKRKEETKQNKTNKNNNNQKAKQKIIKHNPNE